MASALPINILNTLKLIAGINEESDKALHLQVYVDESLSEPMRVLARQSFYPLNDNVSVSLRVFSLDANASLPLTPGQADLVVILANKSELVAELYLANARYAPVVIVAENVTNFVYGWPSNLQIDTACLIAISDELLAKEGLNALFLNLARWMIDNQSDNRLAWARGLAFMRKALTLDIVGQASMQNGAIALVSFIPGTDLPILLLNQMRMFFRLQAIYDVDRNSQTYIKLAALVGQGFFWRGLARQLVRLMPAISWAVKGTVGYLGTLALGRVSELYLDLVEQGFFSESPLNEDGTASDGEGLAETSNTLGLLGFNEDIDDGY
ncbi:MAG: hypothetical protein FWH40_00225 [Coriobacteriia bacterium]|nr:hypothetical protein [Coriobacteriia bacterium]